MHQSTRLGALYNVVASDLLDQGWSRQKTRLEAGFRVGRGMMVVSRAIEKQHSGMVVVSRAIEKQHW